MSKPIEVKLNQQEIATLDFLNLTPTDRAAAEAKILARKRENMAGAIQRREVFSLEVSEKVKQQDGSFKPGKGGVKATGLGSKFPLTLYPEQWEMLATKMPEILAFCKTNADRIHAARKAAGTLPE